MPPASEMPPVENQGGQSRGPARPFVSGRESARRPAQTFERGLTRPFRSGSASGATANAAEAFRHDAVAAEEFGSIPLIPESQSEDARQTTHAASPDDDILLPIPRRDDGGVESDFAPVASWDPLTDVGWSPTPPTAESTVPSRGLIFGSGDATLRPAEAAGTPATSGRAGEEAGESQSREDQFAAKLEMIAMAIRRDRVDELLAESAHDPLIALVAGYYAGIAGRDFGRGSRNTP